MWPTWEPQRAAIENGLVRFSREIDELPGIRSSSALTTISLQFVASLRRERYYMAIQEMPISARRADPNDVKFDAERAVAFHMQHRSFNEAAWLVFLMTHFARPSDSGWLRLKDVYGKLGQGIWDWQSICADPAAFEHWLRLHWGQIRGKFGNHRKYETLRPGARRSTAAVVQSYVQWVGGADQQEKFATIVRDAGNNPHAIFDEFYRQFNVVSFGRLAKFDFLSLLGRYGIVPMDAGSAYLSGATGPLKGARLLFDTPTGSQSSPDSLQLKLSQLDAELNVTMKVMEDALCNWQKSPTRFVHFRG